MKDYNRYNRFSQLAYARRPALDTRSTWPLTARSNLWSFKGGMDIGDILNARHAAAQDAQLRHQLQHSMHMDPNAGYGMHQMHHQPQHHMQHPGSMGYPSMGQPQYSNHMMSAGMHMQHDEGSHSPTDMSGMKSKGESAPKAFACSTCQKGFARRSDLARHERIHSGVRPHACDWPGCGKQFIQRSALTVHARVHTGEKPHMCERCGKPFSDSSSLARHRRIHSGKRPYKCPYANCQKTFTRRTTLTRHQNHHTGTIEQAAAETTAKLSTSQPMVRQHSDGSYTSAASQHSRGSHHTHLSTQSPADRNLSISPNQEGLPPIPNLQRQNSSYGYMTQSHSLPPHMRNDYSQEMPRPTSTSNGMSMNGYTSVPQHRPQTTSHPQNYGPPQPLEPPANGTASGGASPHMAALGWGSPNNGGLPSPSGLDNYAYPDPTYPGQPLYYHGSNMRRPQSTEPEDYGLRGRNMHHMSHNVPNTADWSAMPIGMHMQEKFAV